MQRKSDSIFGALKKTLETANVYQKQSTTIKQNTKPKNTTNIKTFKTLKIQKSKTQKKSKHQKIKAAKSQYSKNRKNPKIKNRKVQTFFQDSLDVKSFGILFFKVFFFSISGFLEFGVFWILGSFAFPVLLFDANAASENEPKSDQQKSSFRTGLYSVLKGSACRIGG